MSRLSKVKTGSQVVFISVDGGLHSRSRLADMGLLPGEKIKVVQNTGHGPVTVLMKGSKVALGHGLAEKIIVKERES